MESISSLSFKLISHFFSKKNDLFILLFQNHYSIPKELLEVELVTELEEFNLIQLDKTSNNIKALVKINYTNGIFLLTDFITKTKNRVFPFVDEGNIYLEYFPKISKYLNHKDTINAWDMCTGSGHPLILIEQELKKAFTNVDVIGTDINERAIKYSLENIELNQSTAKVLHSNLDSSFSPSISFDYIWANPPFGLSPQKDSLHTYGGRYGLEKTIEVIKVINTRLNKDGVAQILTYSIGNKEKDFLISQFLEQELSNFRYEINILTNQKIWRFDGKKRCINPMPIEYLALRATDELYNLNKIPKNNWLDLSNEIKQKGFSHLYFILIDILPIE